MAAWCRQRLSVTERSQVCRHPWFNGRLVQDGSIAKTIFSVAELVAYCSTFFTLAPGYIILTGALTSSCTVSGETSVSDRRSWLGGGERDARSDHQRPEDHGLVSRCDR
ncbi:fumarylacetoacetate hydrolase family protein [Streptomyces microflavus]|uniref:fumarylacetoacetate hydrolase family protein n=1 Tax=Streptomyces microflavus TaxID=1919 RepID=UPI003668D6F9